MGPARARAFFFNKKRERRERDWGSCKRKRVKVFKVSFVLFLVTFLFLLRR